MIDLHISDEIKQRACEVYDADIARDLDDGSHYDEVPEFDLHAEVVALKAVAPAIVAAELRRQAGVLDVLVREIRDEDNDSGLARTRSGGVAAAARVLRTRADDLDGGEQS